MDNRLHQDNTGNRFWFRRVRVYQKRTELCVTTYIRRCIPSHIAVATTEWLPSRSGACSIYSPVINYLLSFAISMTGDMMEESFFIEWLLEISPHFISWPLKWNGVFVSVYSRLGLQTIFGLAILDMPSYPSTHRQRLNLWQQFLLRFSPDILLVITIWLLAKRH